MPRCSGMVLFLSFIFLEFSELSASVLWGFILIWENFQYWLFEIFPLVLALFHLLLVFSLPSTIPFPIVLHFLNQIRSDQISRSVESDSLRPHESLHARPPCPSPIPRVHSDSHPSSQWCHPAISSSVIPFSSCPQFLPALGSFPMSQLFSSGGQSIGVSASTSFLPMNTQDWSPLGWTGWSFLQSRDSQESSPTPQFKSINSSGLRFLQHPILTSIHDYWKNHSLD